MLVEFVKSHAGYNGGEIAAFPDDRAQQMIDRGYAVAHEVKDTKKEERPEPKKVVAAVMQSPAKK